MVSKKSTNFAENRDTKTLFLLLKLPRQRAALNVSHLYCYNGQSGVNVQIPPPPTGKQKYLTAYKLLALGLE